MPRYSPLRPTPMLCLAALLGLLATPQTAQAQNTRQHAQELIRELSALDWPAVLGYNPWVEPEDLARDSEFVRLLHRRFKELAECVYGPGAVDGAEPPPGFTPEADPWFNPFIEDPATLLNQRAFWEQVKRRFLDLNYRCGRRRAQPEDAFGSSICLMSCQTYTNACLQLCAEPGPPAPYCIERCEDRQFWCQVMCLLREY